MTRKTKTMRILIIDSGGESASRIQTLLSNATSLGFPDANIDYHFTHEWRTGEALTVYRQDHPDLVLIDLKGSDLAGKELCRRIRDMESARHTGIIFIAFGVANEDALAVECLELGADDILLRGSTDREVFARINAVLKLKAMTDELRSANHKLHQLSYTDELTGLANMRAFNGKYSKAINECFSGKHGIGVIMLDLDNFKLVNDTTNHLMGSHVIAEVGKLIKAANILGVNDCAARFGGDEYVIFTFDADLEAVKNKGEEIRSLVNKAIFVRDGKSVNVTTSVGVSWTEAGYKGKAEDPIKAADTMLYKSKHEGRNAVSAMLLRDPVDLDHVSSTHFTERNTSSDDDDFARIYNF